MFNKLWTAVDGYKTYIVASLSIVVALIGHYWGPINLGNQQIPSYSWPDVWKVIQTSALFSALRHGIGGSNA